MDSSRKMVDWLLSLTRCGKFGWSSSSNKEIYAVMDQTKRLSFMGSSVFISVLLDPINKWEPVIQVNRLVPCSGVGYYQELFRTRYKAEDLVAAIHWSWQKNAQDAIKGHDPNAQTVNSSQMIEDQAAKELLSQLEKMGEGK